MERSPKTFYLILSLALVSGYTWAFLSLRFTEPLHHWWKGCFLKQFLGLPCPSCGTTRSVISFFQGDLERAFWLNPLGIALAMAMLILPLLLVYDLLKRRSQTWELYLRVIALFQRRPVWLTLALLLGLNWIWNICKGY